MLRNLRNSSIKQRNISTPEIKRKTYGKPKIRTRALSSHSLDAQIPSTHQVVKMPGRTTNLRSATNSLPEDISGQWVGKIITYDWSGMEIEEEIDLEVFIESDGTKFHGLWIENGDYPVQVNAELGDTSWIFSNTILRENARPLEMKQGSLKIEQKENRDYLIGNIHFYSSVTREFTTPNYVLLTRKELVANNIQSDIFTDNNLSVMVSPNPFTDNLNVQFTLDSEQQVSICLYNTKGDQTYAEKLKVYPAGTHIISISTDSYPKGAYILNIAGSINKSLILIK